MIERLKISGYKSKIEENINYGCNPTGQSLLIHVDEDHILIARPLGKHTFEGLSADDELKRRLKAVSLHKKWIPNFTPNAEYAVLQGYIDQEPIPVWARYCEKLDDVKRTSEMTDSEILNNKNLCSALAKINLGYLCMVLFDGILPDIGYYGSFGKTLPKVLTGTARRMTSDSVIVGTNKLGEEKYICDPDWFSYSVDRGPQPLKRSIKYAFLFLQRVVLFQSEYYFHKHIQQ